MHANRRLIAISTNLYDPHGCVIWALAHDRHSELANSVHGLVPHELHRCLEAYMLHAHLCQPAIPSLHTYEPCSRHLCNSLPYMRTSNNTSAAKKHDECHCAMLRLQGPTRRA